MKRSTVAALDTLDTYWAKFDQARAAHKIAALVERPAGSVTAAEYAERYGVTQDTAWGQLRRLEKKGAVKRVPVLMSNARGQMISSPVFLPCATP